MAIEDYFVKAGQKTNICFTCKNACGGCCWSETDPKTDKTRFEPVPGWTAKPVILNVGSKGQKKVSVETYHITACPQYVSDEDREVDYSFLTDKQFAELMKKWRIRGWT